MQDTTTINGFSMNQQLVALIQQLISTGDLGSLQSLVVTTLVFVGGVKSSHLPVNLTHFTSTPMTGLGCM